MNFVSLCQLAGGMVLTFASVPQIIHINKTKQTEGISIATYLLLLLGNSLMMVYAISLALAGNGLLVITTGMSTTTITIIIIMLIKYKKGKK